MAFLVAVSNNFLWNRHWTFSRSTSTTGPVHHQAARFLIVSVGAFLVGLALLAALVEGAGMAEVPAQAIAIVAVTPVSFLANKLWSFAAVKRRGAARRRPRPADRRSGRARAAASALSRRRLRRARPAAPRVGPISAERAKAIAARIPKIAAVHRAHPGSTYDADKKDAHALGGQPLDHGRGRAPAAQQIGQV